MMNYVIATVPEMIMLVTKIMAPAYGIIEVAELHALWDFKGWLVRLICTISAALPLASLATGCT
eukprot:5033130-Pleurochrysis_carterae.AAC.1